MVKNFLIGLTTILILSGFKPLNWRHDHISNSDGLSNSAVTSIFRDSRGFMWFGTWDGLNRFDGSNIKVFKPDIYINGSISNNIIRNIIEDKTGKLWIVTEKGLNSYNFNQESFTPFLQKIKNNRYRENSFHAILGPDSLLWCSVYNYGITHFDSQTNNFSAPIKLLQNPSLLQNIEGLSFSQNDILWILNSDGIVIGLKKTTQWRVLKQYNLSANYEILPQKHWFIRNGDNNFLFIGLKKGGFLAINLETGKITCIHQGDKNLNLTIISKGLKKGVLWGGTDAGRLFKILIKPNIKIDFLKNQLIGLSGKQVKIWSITETKPDMLWIGTDGDGVHKYITKSNFFTTIKKGNLSNGQINHNIVRAIYEDKNGNVWVGTRGNGLNYIPFSGEATRILDRDKGLSNNAVLSLGSDVNGNIWIGVDGEGVDMYETTTGKVLHFPRDFINHPKVDFGFVYSICRDLYGHMWLGTSGYGLIGFSIRKNENGKYILVDHKQYRSDTAQKNGFQSDVIYAIAEGNPNILWIGSRGGGLYRLNTITNKTEVFRSNPNIQNTINNDDILSLWKSNKQELWIGTSGGLNKLNLSTTPYQFSHFTENEGLPNNTIHAILEDSLKNIWLSTNKGLSKINTKTGKIRNYLQSDGLQSNEYTDGASCLGQFSGLLYFGGVNGFNMFKSEQITDSHYFPRLIITEFENTNNPTEILPQNIDVSDTISLPYDQNFFRLKFTALNYHNKRKCKYAYKLENFNQNYIISNGEEKISFTNVPPGEYNFKVKCTNEDGIWSPHSRQIYFIITPPFWKTTWAYLAYICIVSIVLYIVIFLILRRVRIRNQLEMERIKVQKAEELNHYKLQFFTNIAHEFRTPLTLIMAPASQLMEICDKKIAPYVKTIYNNSNRLHHLIRELIDFRKIETGHMELKIREGSLSKLISSVADAFVQYAKQNHVCLTVTSFSAEINGWFDYRILEKILLNLISNAIKYTSQGGTISVSLTLHGDNAHIKVKDTGLGISEEMKDKVFDRFFHKADEFPKLKGSTEGAGIGLSLTKSLVEFHHGEIMLDSILGEGSCFTVIIPLNKEQYREQECQQTILIDEDRIKEKAAMEFMGLEQTLSDKTSIESSNKKSEHTLLIVDDNPQLLNLLSDILYKDYPIMQASNGLEALNILKEENISVVISDIIMPEMDGLKLCQSIKEDINTCHIPVILLTAKGELEHRIEGIEVGADSYIPKPFDPRHLKVRIHQLIKSRLRIQNELRISPEKSPEILTGLNSRDTQFLSKMQSFVEKNLDQTDLDANQMAKELAMSKTQLYRKVKAVTGFTPHGFIKHYRLKKAGNLLKETSLSVTEVIYETGFNNRTYFYRSFKEVFGTSPGNYSKT